MILVEREDNKKRLVAIDDFEFVPLRILAGRDGV